MTTIAYHKFVRLAPLLFKLYYPSLSPSSSYSAKITKQDGKSISLTFVNPLYPYDGMAEFMENVSSSDSVVFYDNTSPSIPIAPSTVLYGQILSAAQQTYGAAAAGTGIADSVGGLLVDVKLTLGSEGDFLILRSPSFTIDVPPYPMDHITLVVMFYSSPNYPINNYYPIWAIPFIAPQQSIVQSQPEVRPRYRRLYRKTRT